MVGPHVVFRLPDGSSARVVPGGMIGRTSSASLRLLDPRVSEAHALVSLRGRELRLIALRGRMQVDGEDETEVGLVGGQRIVFGGAIAVDVSEVVVADRVAALEFDGELRELCADSYSLVRGPPMDLVPRLAPDAVAWIWSTDDGWMVRVSGEEPQRLAAGRSWDVAGTTVRATSIELSAGESSTVGATAPLRLVCRTTTVHIHRAHREPVTVDARAGQLLSELALMGTPAPWATAAELLWPKESDGQKLRRNFDAVVARLRTRLREGGVRENLVRTDGRGNIEVFLQPGDQVVDEA